MVSADDWVLVHDAARPCLPADALARLIDTLYLHPVGGLLAMPVADTLKRADSRGVVESTQPREGLWSAQTPQMFRHGALLAALRSAGAARAPGPNQQLAQGHQQSSEAGAPGPAWSPKELSALTRSALHMGPACTPLRDLLARAKTLLGAAS